MTPNGTHTIQASTPTFLHCRSSLHHSSHHQRTLHTVPIHQGITYSALLTNMKGETQSTVFYTRAALTLLQKVPNSTARTLIIGALDTKCCDVFTVKAGSLVLVGSCGGRAEFATALVSQHKAIPASLAYSNMRAVIAVLDKHITWLAFGLLVTGI